MDPAIAALDFAKAGAIIASMVESYLSAGAPALDAKGAPHDDDVQDQRSTPVADGLRLHPPINDGAGSIQPGEYRAAVQSGEQGAGARLESTADPDPRPRPRSVRCADDQPRGLQDAGQRCGDGQRGSNLLAR